MTFSEPRRVVRALLSVSDKSGLVELAQAFHRLGIELISTGGTAKLLQQAGLPARDISEITGFPEMLDGRVKTLHPRIHAGILAIRGNPAHSATLKEHGIGSIDLVVCNLYPFEETLRKPGVGHDEIVENIDIGGPTRPSSAAAAKNYRLDVAVVSDPGQYSSVAEELTTHEESAWSGDTGASCRRRIRARIGLLRRRHRRLLLPAVKARRFPRR